jgi:hypothetical protein
LRAESSKSHLDGQGMESYLAGLVSASAEDKQFIFQLVALAEI